MKRDGCDMAGSDYHLQQSSDVTVTTVANSFDLDVDSDVEDAASMFMSQEARERLENDESLTDYDRMVIQRLACRKFYIPGHTFWQDYVFWFSNNHPMFCFWYADPRHPLGFEERLVNLMATLAFGLASTSSIVLWFFYENKDFNRVLVSITAYDHTLNLTIGMAILFVFSGPLHVLFDLSMYFLQSCPPFRTGGLCASTPIWFRKFWLWMGAHIAFLITLAALSLGINVVLHRASINDDGLADDVTFDLGCYSFMLLYFLEIFMANFVVFPLGTFTMFSGVLGCGGAIPILGGRPFQERMHKRRMRRKYGKTTVVQEVNEV